MNTEREVIRLSEAQTAEAAQVLCRAFREDPATVYCYSGAQYRGQDWFFALAVRQARRHGGEVHTAEGPVNGVAVWFSSGNLPIGLSHMVRTGMVLAPLRAGWVPFVRFMRCTTPLERLHKQNAPARHWYLQFLGVDPTNQGQGIGSALIQPMLARADAEGVACYLETFNARTVPLYQRHGFEVMVEGEPPKGAPHFWTMMRAPRRR